MRLLDSHGERGVSIFSDLQRVQGERLEVHHLRRLQVLVPEFRDCVQRGYRTIITLESVEVQQLGIVMVSMAEVMPVVVWRMRRVQRM